MSEHTAGTFAPDWDALAKAGNNGYYHGGLAPGDFHDWEVADFKRVAEAVINEWNRQVAATGFVLVRREDVLTARTALRAAPRLAEEVLARFDAIYDATTTGGKAS